MKSSVESSVKIIELIRIDPHITIVEIAEQLNLTTRTIEKNIKLLKEIGKLERVGADNGGYWKIKTKIQ